jgi:hypothetical protein
MGNTFGVGIIVRAFLDRTFIEESDDVFRYEKFESTGPFVVGCFEELPRGCVPVALKAIDHVAIATPQQVSCRLKPEQVHDVGAIAGARASLSYLRNQTDLPKEILALIEVMDNLDYSVRNLEIPVQPDRSETQSTSESQKALTPKMIREALALTILTADPSVTNRQLAKELCCSEASVCRMNIVKEFRKQKRLGHRIPSGVLTRRRDGHVDREGVDDE